MNYTDFILPATLEEAHASLRQQGDAAMPVAGSTLHVFLRDPAPRIAIDLMRLPLSGITQDTDGFEVGATTTIAALQAFRADAWACQPVADAFVTQPIRNVATLGGSIARVFPWSDWPVALLALAADIVIAGDTQRVMVADDFFATQPFRHLAPGDLVTAVRIPALRAGQGFGYCKVKRTVADFSRCTVAARVTMQNGRITAPRIAVGAATPVPCRLPRMEERVEGMVPQEDALRAVVQEGLEGPHWRGMHGHGISNEYARHLAAVHTVDTLLQACDHAHTTSTKGNLS